VGASSTFEAKDARWPPLGLLVYPFQRDEAAMRRGTELAWRAAHAEIPLRRPRARAGTAPTRNRPDVAGVDVTSSWSVESEARFVSGWTAHANADLPHGDLDYYLRPTRVGRLASDNGWAMWEAEEANGGKRRPSWDGLETLVGFRPHPAPDYGVASSPGVVSLGLESRPAPAPRREFGSAGRRRPTLLGRTPFSVDCRHDPRYNQCQLR